MILCTIGNSFHNISTPFHSCFLIKITQLFNIVVLTHVPQKQTQKKSFQTRLFLIVLLHTQEIKIVLMVVGDGSGGGVTRVSGVSVRGSISSRVVSGCSCVWSVSQGGGCYCCGGSISRRQQRFGLGFRSRNCRCDGQDGKKGKELKRKTL